MTQSSPELTADLQKAILESRKAFMATASSARPRLHRFCARMCGSAFDGEDVVQETLADAFYNLGSLKELARLEAWLFRIAYNKCTDFLRRQQSRRREVAMTDEHEPMADHPSISAQHLHDDTPVDAALARIVHLLPPKERAVVLLKDVLDYSLDEAARVVDSTVGGVKSALHRGRARLREPGDAPGTSTLDDEQRRLFSAYAECFNARDWEALSRLVRADATLELVGEKRGDMTGLGATYSTNYTRLPWEWRLGAAMVDSAPVIVHWRNDGETWQPHSAIQLWWEDGAVVRIRDYIYVGYLLHDATVTT